MSFFDHYSWFDRTRQVGETLGGAFCEPLCDTLFEDSDEDIEESKADSTQSLVESSVSTYLSEPEGSEDTSSLPAFFLPGSNTTTSSFEKAKERKMKALPKQRSRREVSSVPYDEDSLPCHDFTPLKTSCTREDDSVPSDEGRRDVEIAARADSNIRYGAAIPSEHIDKPQTDKILSIENIIHVNSWSDQNSVASGKSSSSVKRRMGNAFNKLKAAMKEQRSISPILNELSHLEELFLAESDKDNKTKEATWNQNCQHELTALSKRSSAMNRDVSGQCINLESLLPPPPPPPPPQPKKHSNRCRRRYDGNIQESRVKSLEKAKTEKFNVTAQHMMLNIDVAFARSRCKAATVIQRHIRGLLVRLSVKQAMKHLIQDTAALVIQDAWLAYADRLLQQKFSRPLVSNKYRRKFQYQKKRKETLPKIQEETKSILSCDSDSIDDYDPELFTQASFACETSSMGRKDLKAVVSPPCVHRQAEFPDDSLLLTPFHDRQSSVNASASIGGLDGIPSNRKVEAYSTEHEHAAAIDIQRMNRGMIVRRKLIAVRSAAVQIQKTFRLYSAKVTDTRVDVEYTNTTKSNTSWSERATNTSTGKKQKRRRRKNKKSKR